MVEKKSRSESTTRWDAALIRTRYVVPKLNRPTRFVEADRFDQTKRQRAIRTFNLFDMGAKNRKTK